MSFSGPFYRIYMIFAICFCVLSHGVLSISDEKLQEIEELRAELSAAMEKYEETDLMSKSVVVQPEWTRDDKNESQIDAKVVVTDKKLAEIKRLREEISNASEPHSAADAKHMKKLQKTFELKQRSKTVLDKMVKTAVERDSDEELVGAAVAGDEIEDAYRSEPNIIEFSDNSDAGIDIGKLQHLDFAKRRTKDVLRLKSIVEDLHFTLGEDVLEWMSIWHNAKEYFVGRRVHDIVIIRVGNMHFEKIASTIEVGQLIGYMESFSFWNVAQQQQEGVLLVATQDKVIWYRYNATSERIESYWEWSTGRQISGLTYFTIDSSSYLAVSTNESSRAGFFNLNIYQFVLETREFWIVQRLQLQHPFAQVTVHDTGRDILLAVVQHNVAEVYYFNPRAVSTPDFVRFELRHSFTSESIESIAAFKMGGRSYLALGGMQPQILLYQQGNLVPKTIFDHNFGVVELFFPIPVRTYRDDLILLVQHRVDFSTHTLTVLETLVWNGDYFEANIPVPCQQGAYIAYGVSCMLDMHREAGLKGATLLKREQELAILVPRHQAESGLFYLHTEILAQNSELLDLQDIFAFLKGWVKDQDNLIVQAQAFLAQPLSALSAVQSTPDFSHLELLKTPELRVLGEIGELYVNDDRWTEEDGGIHLDSILQKIDELARDILPGSRQKRDLTEDIVPRFDALDFDEVHVKELLLDKLNNAPFFLRDGELNFDGVLNVQSLEVLDGVTQHGSGADFDSVLPNLDFEGDISFATINGVPWEDIKSGLVFRNQPLTLDKLQVEGEVIFEDDLVVNNLNGLQFPEDFLWSSGPSINTVRAEKTFTGSLAANSVDITGTLNGINPRDAISLTEAQNLTGLVTFANLEIIQGEKINETAETRNVEDIPSNPTLLDSNFLETPSTFAHLEVNGDIIINGQLVEKQQLTQLLADIVQRPASPEERIDIAAPKKFGTVEFPIDFHVESNKINNLNADDFVTLHTEQELDFGELSGFVYFNNLALGGTYDGVDIAELVENSIKIDEPQVSEETQLNFVDTFVAAQVEIADSLNGVPLASGYQTVLENLVVKELTIDSLHVKLAQIHGDIQGSGTLNGNNLGEFFKQRSSTEPTEGGNVFLDELTLQAGLNTDALHGLRAEFLLNFLADIDDLPEMILDGKIQVDHVVISGDVQVNKLNGDNFDEDIQLTAIWLNRPNYLSTNLKFEEPLELLDNIYCAGDMNGESLPERIDDMIFRGAKNATIRITAPKNFEKDVRVSNSVKVSALNGIFFEQIATKRNVVDLAGNLQLSGNIYVQDLELFGGRLNDFDWQDFSQRLAYDEQALAFVLRGETVFNAPMALQDLSVRGDLNSFDNVSKFFDSLVYKNSECLLEGKNTFKGRVAIEEGANVGNLNGLNLQDLLSNIVLISETQPVVVKTPSIFVAPVSAADVLIRESLTTSNLNDCSLEMWLADTMRVDRDETISKFLHFGPGSLDGNEFFASFLNDVDLSRVITLHTPQNLTDNLELSKVYLDVTLSANLPINGVDLQAEYENTFLIYGNQHIETPLTIQSCRVLGELQTNTEVNSAKDLRQVALLQESLEFRSPLFLQNITAKNLYTNDLVSGINLDQWHKTALWLNDRTPQWITGNWSVRSLTVQAPSERSLAEMGRFRRSDDEFTHVCLRVVKLLQRRARSFSFVKYIEEAFELTSATNETIHQVFTLTVNSEDLLLLNSNCHSHFFKWNASEQIYQTWSIFESGQIDQTFAVSSNLQNSTLKFITNSSPKDRSNCSRTGLNSWSLKGTVVIHLHSLGHNYTSIHQSHPESTHFYALNRENQLIYEFNLTDDLVSNTWQLHESVYGSTDSFRFLPSTDNTSNVSLTNGQQIFVLIKNGATDKVKRSSSFRLSVPLVSLDAFRELKATSESVLHPINDTTPPRKLDFADFEQVLVRILHDLNWRLGVEINITQLSIPESDLYDLSLVQDFIDIMQELTQQQIFPPTMFAAVKLEKLQLPVNPAQVLAARTVQIIWPVIVEIEEVHGYLKEIETHSHPVCARIAHSLGLTIRDVLLLAYKSGNNKSHAYMKDMMAVIKRIRRLQATLDVMANNITADIERTLNDGSDKSSMDTATSSLEPTRSSEESKNVTANGFNETLDGLSVQALLPADWLSETLVFDVGSALEPRTLTAFVSLQSHLTPSQQDVIKLFTSVAGESKLFQIVLANKPRSLVSLRIHEETLLAFVENCCVVRVLIYRGVEGFVEFVKFTTKEKILTMIALSLTEGEALKQRHFLAANMGKRVQFYEVVTTGDKRTSQETYECA